MDSQSLQMLRLRQGIRQCRRCGLAEACSGPVPPEIPKPLPDRPRLLILGEAPGGREDRLVRPFSGPAGQLARKWLAESAPNLHGPSEPAEPVWANVVCCWPRGTPDEAAIEACRGNLIATLGHTQPDYLLAFGGVALDWLLPGKRISEWRGMWWKQRLAGKEVFCFSTYHPAYVLRNRHAEKEVAGDVANFLFYGLGHFDPPIGVVGKGKKQKYWQQERLI